MKGRVYLLLLGICCTGCELTDPGPGRESGFDNRLTHGLCISFGDSILISHKEIEYYDQASHMIFLKENHSIFDDLFNLDMAYKSFTVYAFEEEIYSGIIFPAWSSSMPSGPFIPWPSFYPGYVIKIDYSSYPGDLQSDTLTDPRNDRRIVEALQMYGQYHPGLSLDLGPVQVTGDSKVSFTYTLTNNDSFDYYVLSPDKMGSGLFHYFTNGLYLYSQETGWLQQRITVEYPDPWDSWESNWLDRLNHQTSRTYQIEYEEFDQVPAGIYTLHFRFPGLTGIEKEERNIDNGLIWMGELASGEITIQVP